MSKIIIGIHGLGNKPPKALLESWWKKAIIEGYRSRDMLHPRIPFEMVYWADIVHPEPLNPRITDSENPFFLDEPYRAGTLRERPVITGIRRVINKFIEGNLDTLFLNDDNTLNFSGLTNYIIKKYFRELDLYYSGDPSIRQAICERLERILRKYKRRDILLIGHSMGSIIAYDVLTRMNGNSGIDVFVTLGSPLGLPIITSRIAGSRSDDFNRDIPLTTPESIRRSWYNLSDADDHVALDHSIADEYADNSGGVHVIDKEVYNNYHNDRERNPHKSYGYLRSAEMTDIVAAFLGKARFSPDAKIYRVLRDWLRKLRIPRF